MSRAQEVADLLGNDGTNWEAADGRSLGSVCSGSYVTRDGNRTKYEFGDGSCIVASGAAWDLGYPEADCYCWASMDHNCGEK